MIFYVFILYKRETYTQFSRSLFFIYANIDKSTFLLFYVHYEKTFVGGFCIPPIGKIILTIDISTSIFAKNVHGVKSIFPALFLI